jgi:hypothetical protein
MGKLSQSGNLEKLTSELDALGFDIRQGNFESVSWAGHSYNLGTLRQENKPDQAGILVILDDDGNLIAKMEARG